MTTPDRWYAQSVATVSFDSHVDLLNRVDPKTGRPLTAFRAIAEAGGAPGKLGPAAQFLVVRFGLYPLLHRTVDTLSTGEVRKVLLIRALSQRPRLLLLDNAFDGLDVPSRDVLKDIVSRTIGGFTNDLLVQGVHSKATARTQIVLATHRAEEIVPEINRFLLFQPRREDDDDDDDDDEAVQVFERTSCDGDDGNEANDSTSNIVRSSKEALYRAMGFDHQDKQQSTAPQHPQDGLDWNDHTLPSKENVQTWWGYGRDGATTTNNDDDDDDDDDTILIEAKGLSVHRGGYTLLEDLDWTVRRGQRWIVGGGNGAGKSTLSRLLANPREIEDPTKLQVWTHDAVVDQGPSRTTAATVGWVSTESHLLWHEQTERRRHIQNVTVEDLLSEQTHHASWEGVIAPVLSWLDMTIDDPQQWLFSELSQGQQKLLLLACAIAQRPPILVLDEPCQGLDVRKRRRLLQVLDRLCSSTDLSLIYITHHLEEELIPSITHAIHLKDRRAVYQGPIGTYRPDDYYHTKTGA
jgi:molybdate transport system ATP-binding protein